MVPYSFITVCVWSLQCWDHLVYHFYDKLLIGVSASQYDKYGYLDNNITIQRLFILNTLKHKFNTITQLQKLRDANIKTNIKGLPF